MLLVNNGKCTFLTKNKIEVEFLGQISTFTFFFCLKEIYTFSHLLLSREVQSLIYTEKKWIRSN